MHYRNGREAKNGDKIVKLNGGAVVAFGVLHSATPGNDYCNGSIAAEFIVGVPRLRIVTLRHGLKTESQCNPMVWIPKIQPRVMFVNFCAPSAPKRHRS